MALTFVIRESYSAEYMHDRHGLSTSEADEAINDIDAVWFDPDPKSRSGDSVRVIGYSRSATAVLTVILLPNPEGQGWIGLNGWRSNSTERRTYREEAE